MTTAEYIDDQPQTWQNVLLTLHGLVLHHDPAVTAEVAPLMGKQMIVYLQNGHFKYALAIGKHYLSLHCMPIYCQPGLREKYQALLPGGKFQKSCINFTTSAQIFLPEVGKLLADCAAVNMEMIQANHIASK